MIKPTPISNRIQTILDTPYRFDGKHAEFMKKFTYKQESKYMITPYEDHLLQIKFDQLPKDGSYWEERGTEESGRVRFVEINPAMETFG